MESWGKGVYKEIMEPEKIGYTDYFSDAEGNINDSMPSTEITLEFIDLGGKIKLINRAEYVSAESLKNVMDLGMRASRNLGAFERACGVAEVELL